MNVLNTTINANDVSTVYITCNGDYVCNNLVINGKDNVVLGCNGEFSCKGSFMHANSLKSSVAVSCNDGCEKVTIDSESSAISSIECSGIDGCINNSKFYCGSDICEINCSSGIDVCENVYIYCNTARCTLNCDESMLINSNHDKINKLTPLGDINNVGETDICSNVILDGSSAQSVKCEGSCDNVTIIHPVGNK